MLVPTSLRVIALSVGTGLFLGLGAGYWLGQSSSSQMAVATKHDAGADAVAINPGMRQPDHPVPTPAVSVETGAGPSGFRLVGTIVDAERKQSKAWLQETATDTTQAFSEGESFADGYLIESIGADMLTASKEGRQYVIRRTLVPSTATAGSNAPDRASSHPAEREATARGRDYADRPSTARYREPHAQTIIKGGDRSEKGVRPMSARRIAGWADANQGESVGDGAESGESTTNEAK